MSDKPRIMTVLGTRPEIIRLSRIIAKLDPLCEHLVIHTGQNFDPELDEIFFRDLQVRRPDRYLNARGSFGEQMAVILPETEKIMHEFKPERLLILGDTNSSIAGIMAKRLKIPLFHMEAGNRCFDFNVPEEINRRIIDHIADVNLAYSENSRRYLLDEGLPQDRTFVSGSPMREVLTHYAKKIEKSSALADLDVEPGRYFLASLHREENVDFPKRLDELLAALDAIARRYKLPVIVSTHPRTRKRLESDRTGSAGRVRFCKPFSFTDYVCLQKSARCVISDSGTISEESAILRFPAVTIRDAIERPEAIDEGSIIVTGVDRENILRCVDVAIETASDACPEAYNVTNTSDRVLRIILGYIRYVNQRVWRKGTL